MMRRLRRGTRADQAVVDEPPADEPLADGAVDDPDRRAPGAGPSVDEVPEAGVPPDDDVGAGSDEPPANALPAAEAGTPVAAFVPAGDDLDAASGDAAPAAEPGEPSPGAPAFEAATPRPETATGPASEAEPRHTPTRKVRGRRVPGPEAWPDPFAGGRPGALRLAALHLRLGQHALARAELEALAGRGWLDEPGLLDLAEVRWRTGDLPGAGEAANALLARGTEAPLALVIAAEAVSAVGRPGEARRLSSRALKTVDGPLDPLFAGMPRALIWPMEPMGQTPAADAGTGAMRGRGRARVPAPEDGEAASNAAEAFAGGRAALAAGDATRAALLLGVAMRLEPGFARDVLRAVAGRDEPPLTLVRGDALRLLGREAEALAAFDLARGRSGTAEASDHPGTVGPGLFDDDPAIAGDERA